MGFADDVRERLRAARRSARVSVADVASACGKGKGAIYMMERGESSPTLEHVEGYAAALRTTPLGLLQGGGGGSFAPLSGQITTSGKLQSALLVTRGAPVAARGAEEATATVPVEPSRTHCIAVRYNGEPADIEWADIHLRPGDLLIFDPKTTPAHGDLVAAVWRHRRGRLKVLRELEGEQLLYPPVYDPDNPIDPFTDDWSVLGVVVEVRSARANDAG